jgi:cyanosortase A-associated protein
MSTWKWLRTGLLAVTTLAVAAIAAYAAMAPPVAGTVYQAYRFSEQVQLPGWTALPSENIALTRPIPAYHQLIASKLYHFQQLGRKLDIQAMYLVDTDGDVQNFAQDFTPSQFSQKPAERHRAGLGFYQLSTQGTRSILSACINPRGESTVTAAQFEQNRRTLDRQADRWLPWLLNQVYLADRRCIWTAVSLDAVDLPSEQRTALLEQTWFAWLPQQKFPNP